MIIYSVSAPFKILLGLSPGMKGGRKMPWQFALFLIITLIRQIPHLKMEIFGKKEKKYSEGKNLAIGMYIFYLLIWLPALYQVFRRPPEFGWLLVISIILLVVGIGLRFLSLASLGRFFTSDIVIQKEHRLIKTGPYRIVRHPIYLAMILELAGMIGFSRVVFLLLFWITMIFVLVKQAQNEDKILRQEFGQEAKDYQEKVPAMLPAKRLKELLFKLQGVR